MLVFFRPEFERFCASWQVVEPMLSPPAFSLSVARNHRPFRSATRPWGLPALTFTVDIKSPETIRVAACLRVARACISLRIPFCLSNPLGSYLWKISGHSPLCFWITLEKSHSSCFRRIVCPCLFSQSTFLQISVSRKAWFL